MRIYKEVERPAYKTSVCEQTKCDLCDRTTVGEEWESSHWRKDEVTVELTQVSQRSTESYGDSGNTEEIIVDLCPDCFRNKLVPWLESQGMKVKTKVVDW